MSDLRAAAQQALKALKDYERHTGFGSTATDALRAALEQPEQSTKCGEPVAWLRREELADLQTCNYRHLGADSPRIWAPHQPDAPDPEQDMVPVYTHPPRREWRGLTEEEVDALIWHPNGKTLNTNVEYARAVEAALKEKNHE